MKIKYFILLSFISITAGSCKNFLDTKPKDGLFPGNYYKTEKELDYALAAVYSSLGADGIYGNNALYLLGWSGDEGFMNRFSIPTGAFRLNHTAGDSYVTAFWREAYNGINRANALLESVNNNTAIPEAKRNTVRGEALFLRAYFHFLLVQNYGGVPLKLTSSKSAIAVHIPKNTVKEVYDQIVKDMTEAEPLVGDISMYGFGGRVSKSAVRGILMRVNLYMAGYPLKDVTRYQEVINWGKKIMEDGLAAHRLNPSYSNIFITLAQEKYDIKESIWEIEFIGNNTEAYNETGRNGFINGISTANTNTGKADAYMSYTAKLYNAYEPGDLRKFWNIPLFNYAVLPAANGVKTLIAEIPLEATKYKRHPGKFRREYETQIPKSTTRSPINVQILRYTDVLLMYAEALNELQTPADAVSYVNEVRRRGWSTGVKTINIVNGGTGYTTAPTVTFSAGNGSTAIGKATVVGGVVTKIDLDRDPNGVEFFLAGKYTTPPTITFSGGGGTGAQATATIYVPQDADVKAPFLASREAFRKFLYDERLREFNFENIRKADLIRWEIFEQTHRDMAAMMAIDIPAEPFLSYYTNLDVPKHLLLPIPSAEMVTNNKMVQNIGW